MVLSTEKNDLGFIDGKCLQGYIFMRVIALQETRYYATVALGRISKCFQRI